MIFGKKKPLPIEYDKDQEYPVIRSSICTGEEVAGFKDRESGHFREEMLIRNDSDRQAFCTACGITLSQLKKEY
ncbi:MAG: aspartate dehydrogenase [Lachnospiraceae bacterium]|nr:aspartate dehydrogenase [Lachnospiraceae bacterium]